MPAFLAGGRSWLQDFGGGESRWRGALFESGDWLLCGLLTPIIFGVARRWPLERAALARRLPLHAAFSLVCCVAWATLGVAWGSALHGKAWTPYGMGLQNWILNTLPFGVAVYFSVLGVEHALFYLVQSARLSAQLADARLAALSMQMRPHFLLNSLNAITVIVRDKDTATATRMLEQLGDLLRRVLRSGRPAEVPLSDELDFVRQYLAIEEMRFSDRLKPVFSVDDAVLAAAVPEFLLQPLVENALRHGLERRATATMVRIEARREGDDLVIAVTDDGPGPEADEPAEGVGLANTRERLQTLYGGRARLELLRTTEGGARATVRLPFRRLEGTGG